MAETIKAGDTISVNYTGRFENGEVFDSSEGREPLKFTVGAGQLIKGFDDAVVGLTTGDKTTITVEPKDGYGEHREDLIIDIPKANVPEELEVEVGKRFHLKDQSGRPVPAVVVEITEEAVRLDANHAMAGKTLIFDIEVVETGLQSEAPAAESHCGDGSNGCQGCGQH
ncbi:peptidylprolyl cis-trans isomerase, FKBP-type [Syntrophotalea carbinolica DSM 2380]|uniref:Peptidyl-prolyl cis-trans isomerase n=1 Tax=Syntrophotalea carbinolica (strain DSM 2380 / NBRC 103641 / GraBd1) TaxID=338963 RepID=Q3A2U1_SYNC1|nr:peptidylprolyl isomerase [Syntrophotalea carbinolica]ABA89316.1 peptidylprolyl cis-trans isomerase, FKBP-type [Syntrophotalea carbinolica DSM 2380]